MVDPLELISAGLFELSWFLAYSLLVKCLNVIFDGKSEGFLQIFNFYFLSFQKIQYSVLLQLVMVDMTGIGGEEEENKYLPEIC